ncbi:predicted protein [Uncinocarpus reesii 1704]|uniref:Enoyl reductase (ER) domain-containing protein n=1 Tax=Uncinocarpus reesii (strain UAMH 1704) TaxID=336963 RepID=C4JK13_UNCRE|nr:uncharacterized protein UREG_01970 [Uncinocarpus reesii 1704]EEP77121.1 predicted protein [Uncinocarpus reesii 1704]
MQPTGASEELIPPTMPAVYLPAPPSGKNRKPKPSNLIYKADFPTPHCTETQYLVKVSATALCPGELEWPHLLHRRENGAVIGHDICGTVLSTPVADEHLPDGPRFKVGDRVFGLIELARDGGAADCVAAEEEELALKPQNISAVEAASIPLSALTAYQILCEHILFKDSMKEYGRHKDLPFRILILNGTGDVGIQAIQILRSKSIWRGYHIWVCATTTTTEHERFLRDELHADEVLNSVENPDLAQVWKHRNWPQVHLILDCMGGGALSRACIQGILDKAGATTSALEAICDPDKHQVEGGYFGVKPNGVQLGMISKLVEDGEIKPYVDKVFELHEAKEAMEYVESRKARGKVVVHVNYD